MPGITANTKIMLHMDGSDASTVFTDSSSFARTMTTNGDAQIDTAQSVFGGASGLFDGNGDYLSAADSADFAVGTGDFCIDFRARFASVSGTQTFFSGNTDSTSGYLDGYYNGSGQLWMRNHVTSFAASFTPTVGIWYHFAFLRLSGTCHIYVDGTWYASSAALSASMTPVNGLLIGRMRLNATNYFNGHLDEVRFTVGSACINDSADPLYISSADPTDGFTSPAAAYAATIVRYSSFATRASAFLPQTVSFPVRNIAYDPTKMFASFPTRSVSIQGQYSSFVARNHADVPQYCTFAARNEVRVIRTASFTTRNDINTVVNASFPVRQMAMYAPGWNIYVTDMSTDITTFAGFIDAEAAHVLSDVSIVPGTYELEARPIQHLWEDTTSAIRKPLTIKSATPTTPVAGVPDIINLTGTNSAGWTTLQWGVSAQPTGSNPRFGVWRGSTPVDLTGAAESVIYYDEQVQTYTLHTRQTASTYFAVLCVAGDVIGTATEVQVLVAASTLAKPTGVFAK